VDEFGSVQIENLSTPAPSIAPTDWRFEDPEAAAEWKAGDGVEGLRSRDGRLTGRSTTKVPILHAERSSGLDEGDILHEVVVRARASKGSNLAITFRGSETVDVGQIASRAELFPWALTTAGSGRGPNLPHQRFATTVTGQLRDTRHVLSARRTRGSRVRDRIRAARVPKEHLASIPSGVGWQGLGEIYRESIVSRSPERLRFEIRVPENAFLDLALGTVEDGPVTFKVSANDIDLERTLTTPNRWEELTLDLARSRVGNSRCALLEAETTGALGFWGLPREEPGSSRPRGWSSFSWTPSTRPSDAYGFDRETAPNVSRLAAEGVLFEDAIAQGPGPSLGALDPHIHLSHLERNLRAQPRCRLRA
jgi:hypothetical protein